MFIRHRSCNGTSSATTANTTTITTATTTITTATTATTTTIIITATTMTTTVTTATVTQKEDKLTVFHFCVQSTLLGRDPYPLRTTREDGAAQTDRP